MSRMCFCNHYTREQPIFMRSKCFTRVYLQAMQLPLDVWFLYGHFMVGDCPNLLLLFFLMLLQICQIHCTPTKYYCHSTWTIKMNHPVTKYQNTARTIIVNIIASIIVGIIVILKYEKNKCSPCSYYRQRYLEQACLRFSM